MKFDQFTEEVREILMRGLSDEPENRRLIYQEHLEYLGYDFACAQLMANVKDFAKKADIQSLVGGIDENYVCKLVVGIHLKYGFKGAHDVYWISGVLPIFWEKEKLTALDLQFTDKETAFKCFYELAAAILQHSSADEAHKLFEETPWVPRSSRPEDDVMHLDAHRQVWKFAPCYDGDFTHIGCSVEDVIGAA